MDTAHKTDEEKKEFFDSDEELEKKITALAEAVKISKHFVVFTGAGISTGAGIKDFRSGVNTVLPTGPGCWEKLATKDNTKPKVSVNMLKAVPTPAHMALVKLQQVGILKFLISQNVDGLHRRSGFPAEQMAEVHGNTNLEICKKPTCGKQYLRDFRVRTAQSVHDHVTTRTCSCGGLLYDSIINFGENLPEKALNDGFEQCAKADVCLILGSSLRVTPAADMPKGTAKKKGKIFIVNLQSTPLDGYAVRINGLIDKVMISLMTKLKVEIPKFTLSRRMTVKHVEETVNGKKKRGLAFSGIDSDGSQYSLFTQVAVGFPEVQEAFLLKKEPFVAYPVKQELADKGIVQVKLGFQGHYGEPDLAVEIPLKSITPEKTLIYGMTYDPDTGKWDNLGPVA
jgi:NAD-dependent SIR2 family protein deacetylase